MTELSVIVTSYESPQVLEQCLEALSAQADVAEIVVADCSRRDPGGSLGERFPAVRFLHFNEPRTVPRLRWAALPETSGEIVGAIEARTIPTTDWAARILAAHRAGLKTVILPKRNEADLDDVPEDVRREMTFHIAETIDEVLGYTLCTLSAEDKLAEAVDKMPAVELALN